jgi:hypothetical protein
VTLFFFKKIDLLFGAKLTLNENKILIIYLFIYFYQNFIMKIQNFLCKSNLKQKIKNIMRNKKLRNVL